MTAGDPWSPPANALRRRAPWGFFLLVFALSTPFYMLGAAGGRLPFASFLPLSALMAFVPMSAALMLIHRERGASGAKALLGRAFDYRRIKGVGWILLTLSLMPLILVLEYGVRRLFGAAPLDAVFPIVEVLAFFAMFLAGAIGEELGWQGYAFDRFGERQSTLVAALILGVAWALWHVIPFVQMGRGGDWIFWHCLNTVLLRVILVWLFVNAGRSVFIAVLFHVTTNGAWGVFPDYGRYYDPLAMFVILALVTTVVVAFWGSSTLSDFRPRLSRSAHKR